MAGNFTIVGDRLIQFMGKDDALFLEVLTDHALHKGKRGKVFFSSLYIQDHFDINRKAQTKILKRLSKLKFLNLLNKRGPKNTRYVTVYLIVGLAWTWALDQLYDVDDENVPRKLRKLHSRLMASKNKRYEMFQMLKPLYTEFRDETHAEPKRRRITAKDMPQKMYDTIEKFRGFLHGVITNR